MQTFDRRALAAGAVLLSCSQMGCSVDRYYVARGTFAQSSTYSADDESRVVDEDARSVLRQGATVAFLPPDNCATTSAAPKTSYENQQYAGTNCGSLMSELEKRASTAGYNVVSWQLLKGGNPLDRARDLKVEALFEINEFSTQGQDAANRKLGSIAFVDRTAGETPIVVEDATTVGQRCRTALENSANGPGTIRSATLSIKMVGVKDGRAKWFFRKTVGPKTEDQESVEKVYVGQTRSPGGGVALIVLGVAAGVAGGVLMGTAGSTPNSNGGNTPGPGFFVGIPLIAGGVAMVITGAILAGTAGSSRGSADGVLCVPGHELHAAAPSTPDAPHNASGTGYQFEENRGQRTDQFAASEEKLRRKVVGGFIKEMKIVAGIAPTPAPAQ